MQWDGSPNAGFSAGAATPWLPLAADYRERNVAAQDSDPGSMLTLFRRLTALRRSEPALNRGTYEAVDMGAAGVLAYRRTQPGHDGFLVALNMGPDDVTLDLRPSLGSAGASLALSTDASRDETELGDRFILAGNEGVIIRLPMG